MFQFKKNVLDPVLRGLVTRVEENVPGENAEQRLEKLSGILNDADAELGKVEKREWKGMAVGVGIMAAIFLLPASLPGLGVLAWLAGTALMAKKVANFSRLNADRDVLVNQLEKKALDLVEANPQYAPLALALGLVKNIRTPFNDSADAKQASKFTALVQRLNPPTTCLKWD